MTEEEARNAVFALISKWCVEVGGRFNVTIEEHSAEIGPVRPRRVAWYSGNSFGFSAEYRAMTWQELLPLMEAEPEGYLYLNEWEQGYEWDEAKRKEQAARLMALDED